MTHTDASLLGKRREDLDTPALLVDLDLLDANMSHLNQYCRSHGTGWRPHSKAHKSPEIARLELEKGAIGITCAKLSEAEMMVANGIGPILIANQVVTPAKLQRLAALQERQEVIVSVDSREVALLTGQTASAMGTSIPVLAEVDIGLNRVGISPGEPALELTRAIVETPGLRFRGLMGYEGHVLAIEPPEEKRRACHQALGLLIATRDLLEADGIPVEIVSAGGTGCFEITAAYEGITEVQAGGGIFMDAMYRERFHVNSLNFALTVLTTVTSRSEHHVILDAGFKTMSAFHHSPQPLHRKDLTLRGLSAEHGIFDIIPGEKGPRIGEQVEVIPGYSDSTNVLHDRFLCMRDGRVERIWNIEGRGLLT